MKIKILYLIFYLLWSDASESAALLPQSFTTAAAKITINISEQLLGEPCTAVLVQYGKQGKYYTNWYLRSVSNPTPHELIQNSLWYSIEYGTKQSLTGETPYQSIKRQLSALFITHQNSSKKFSR